MSGVEQAQAAVTAAWATYAVEVIFARWHQHPGTAYRCKDLACPDNQRHQLAVEAASIALDLANAQAAIERTRASVAWA